MVEKTNSGLILAELLYDISSHNNSFDKMSKFLFAWHLFLFSKAWERRRDREFIKTNSVRVR